MEKEREQLGKSEKSITIAEMNAHEPLLERCELI